MSGRGRIRLAEARSALRVLMDDPERTEKVFEIVEAVAGRQPERLVRAVRNDPSGPRLFAERPEFDASTCDFDALLALPDGSFGRTYAEWMREHAFTPGLTDREVPSGDPDVVYLAQRLTQVHDFWHVLSGYNRDPVGELGVLTFGWAQIRSRGIGFILANVLWRDLCEHWQRGRWMSLLAPHLWHAWRAGRRARFLAPLILEDFFELPLGSLRKLLAIQPLEKSIDAGALAPIAAPSRIAA
jgi:ubiquinone biosynthesis protein COQ4